jgi:hypothetical protein
MEVFPGIRDRFADVRVSSEMHDRVGARKNTPEGIRIKHIALHKFKTRGQKLISGAKIVEDNDFVSGAFERTGRVTANVSSAAND